MKQNSSFSSMEKKWLLEANRLSEKELESLAKITRNTRSRYHNSPSTILATNCVAPLYIPFISYILNNAIENHIQSIYFLARDGYILHKIANQLKEDKHNIELKYLHISRKSITLPYLANSIPKDFLAIFPGNTIIGQDVSVLLSKFSTEYKDLKSNNVDIPFKIINSIEEEEFFLDCIYSHSIHELWNKKANHVNEEFVAYLKNIGLLENDSIAIVDVGWLGTTRLMLHSILNKNHPNLKIFKTYFWGARNDAIFLCDDNMDVFTDDRNGGGRVYTLIEDYCSACPHPTTIGYKDGEPVFKEMTISDKYLSLVDTNVKICETIAQSIKKTTFNQKTLKLWCELTYKLLDNFEVNIDYSPLVGIKEFEKELVKKLNISETISIFQRKHVTTLDIASLDYTYGYPLRKLIFMLLGVK